MLLDEFTTDTSGFIDVNKTGIAKSFRDPVYIKVIDDLFSAKECADLIKLAESGGKWEIAKINTYGGEIVDTTYRNSGRILRFDHEAAAKLFERLKPFIEDVMEIKEGSKWETVAASSGCLQGTFKMVGLNERLSFLKYGPGEYFQPHCDGQLTLPDMRTSRITVQIYLNDSSELSGGSTRIFGSKGRYLDIHPRLGRVLIFQQRGVFHSGEEVEKGMKYTLRTDFMYKYLDKEEEDM